MATHSPSPNTAFKRKPITVNTGWSHDKPLPQINDKDRPCPSCGAPSQAQRMVPKDTAKQDADRASKRIAELEAEVRMLSEKARDAGKSYLAVPKKTKTRNGADTACSRARCRLRRRNNAP